MAAKLVMWPGPFEQIFIQSTPGGSIWNVFTIGPLAFEEMVENVKIWAIWIKGKKWLWPLVLIILHELIKTTVYTNFLGQNLQNFPWNLMFYHFPIFDLAVKRSKSTQGHNLNNLYITQVPNATYKVSRPSVNWFRRRRFLKVFTILVMLVMCPGPLVNFFIPSTPWGSKWNLVSIGPVVLEQIVWNCQNLRFLGQRSKNDLDLLYWQIFMYSLRWLYIPIFRPKSSKLSMKSHVLAFSDIWPCGTKGQGQPRVIIWTILIVLEYPMLHTKFQGHRPIGSGRRRFFQVFTIWARPDRNRPYDTRR